MEHNAPFAADYKRNLGQLYEAIDGTPPMQKAADSLLALSRSNVVIARNPEVAFRAAAGVAFLTRPQDPLYQSAVQSLTALANHAAMPPEWSARANTAAYEYTHTTFNHKQQAATAPAPTAQVIPLPAKRAYG